MIICCDIDGVLADVRSYVEEYLPHDWKTYFSHTEEFEPIQSNFDMVNTLLFDHQLVFVSGRPQANRIPTTNWLQQYLHLTKDDQLTLRLRADADHRPTYEIKMEWFRELKPDLIIDDDPEVVKAATVEGFIVLQVHGFRCTERDSIPTNYLEEENK